MESFQFFDSRCHSEALPAQLQNFRIKKTMKDFLLTEQLQYDFCSAIRNKNPGAIPKFIRDNERVIGKVERKLTSVHFSSTSPFDSVCKFICDNSLVLLNELSNPYSLNFPKGSVGHEFHRHLMSAKHTMDWQKFYDEHEVVFDAIIQRSRDQDVLRIEVERNGKRYRSLKDARLDRMANRAEFPLLKFQEDNYYDDSGNIENWRRKSLSIEVPASNSARGLHRSQTIHSEGRKLERSPRTYSESSAPWTPGYQQENVPEYQYRRPLLSAQRNSPRRESHSRERHNHHQYQRPRLGQSHIDQMSFHHGPIELGQDLALASEERIRFFHRSGDLKLSWAEQRNEWDSWLKSTRDAILVVKRNFVNFGFKSFDTIQRQYDELQFRGEIIRYIEDVANAYDKLNHDFKALTAVLKHYEDKMFVKVLQRIICETADRLCSLLEALRSFKFEEIHYLEIQALEDDINPRDIPTASTLRQICDSSRPEDYKNVVAPRKPRR